MKKSQKDQFSLEDKVVLLTGATGNLGPSIALALVKAGAQLILSGRNREKLDEVAQALKKSGYNASTIAVDLLDYSAVESKISLLLQKQGRLDVLINNAYAGRTATYEQANLTDFSAAYDITVLAAYHLIKICLPFLKKSQNASIINVATMYAHVSPDPRIYGKSGFNNPPHYGAAKAGLVQLTRYLACHLAPSIRVNSISPGPFPEPALKEKFPDFYENLCKKVPLQRIGRKEELGGPILFLASEASSFITGIDLKVDGGWTAW